MNRNVTVPVGSDATAGDATSSTSGASPDRIRSRALRCATRAEGTSRLVLSGRQLVHGLGSSHHGASLVGDRLPRGGCRRDGHGLHRRPDRPCRRSRHARRPSACAGRPLAGRLSVRPAPPGVDVLRRRVDGARHRSGAAGRPGSGAPGARSSVGGPELLRPDPRSPLRGFRPCQLPQRQRVPHRRHLPSRHVPGDGGDHARRGSAASRRRDLPRTHHPADDPPAVRRG